jgi:hypothetical protein
VGRCTLEKEKNMMSFIYVIGVFAVFLLFHGALHRFFIHWEKKRIALNLIYLLGFIVLWILWRRGLVSLPFSSSCIYLLMSLFVSYFYMTFFLAGETPSSIILDSFLRKKQQARSELLHLFSEQGLVLNRLDDLISTHLIIQKKDVYRVTSKGRILAVCIFLYEYLFHRVKRG